MSDISDMSEKIFKIWTADRKVKKMVRVTNYVQLQQAACDKLELSDRGCHFVLENDGTEIDSDVIMDIGDQTLLALCGWEEWIPAQVQDLPKDQTWSHEIGQNFNSMHQKIKIFVRTDPSSYLSMESTESLIAVSETIENAAKTIQQQLDQHAARMNKSQQEEKQLAALTTVFDQNLVDYHQRMAEIKARKIQHSDRQLEMLGRMNASNHEEIEELLKSGQPIFTSGILTETETVKQVIDDLDIRFDKIQKMMENIDSECTNTEGGADGQSCQTQGRKYKPKAYKRFFNKMFKF